MKKEAAVSFWIRIGLAFAFFYAAISSLVNPNSWIGFLPRFVTSVFSASILLIVFSIYELLLGIWLLSNKKIFYAALLSAATMFFIVIFNLGALDIVFRDIAIFFMVVALAVLVKSKK